MFVTKAHTFQKQNKSEIFYIPSLYMTKPKFQKIKYSKFVEFFPQAKKHFTHFH